MKTWIIENKVWATIIFLALVALIVYAVKYFTKKPVDKGNENSNIPVSEPHVVPNPHTVANPTGGNASSMGSGGATHGGAPSGGRIGGGAKGAR